MKIGHFKMYKIISRICIILSLNCMIVANAYSVLLSSFQDIDYAKTDNMEQLLRDYVTTLINEGYELFNDPTITKIEREKKVEKLLRENLYLEWMAKYSLGRHRRTLSKEKIAEFVEVYSKFVVKAYVDLTQHYKGETATLKAVRKFDDDMFIVYLEIEKPGSNSPIRVDYLVHQIMKKNGNFSFMVADIITEGISILNSQQAEFNSIITNQGIDALIANLKEKLGIAA